MNRARLQIARLLLLTLTGTIGAIVAGLCVYGSEVFSITSPGFSFVSFGFSGALIFAFYHVRGLSESITAAVVVSAVQFVAVSQFITMLRAVLFSFGLNIPVIALAFVFERKLAPHARWKFVVVGLTYGAMFVVLTLIIDLLSGGGGLPATLFRENLFDGLLLGTGLGLGIEGGEAMVHSLEMPQTNKHRE
jgi:hypothetical protein